jgi:DNA mismatch endonuclease, patch repair protein
MTGRLKIRFKTPRFQGYRSASPAASASARGSSRKYNTACEVLLRRELYALGLRYRVATSALIGCPDIVFGRARVAVFVDGDFWHGRHLRKRLRRLAAGHNPTYWVTKIRSNVSRDALNTAELKRLGWLVLRVWETDVRRDVRAVALRVMVAVKSRVPTGGLRMKRGLQ